MNRWIRCGGWPQSARPVFQRSAVLAAYWAGVWPARVARRWAPEVAAGFQKASTHLALDDVRDSVRELEYYRSRLFAPAFSTAAASAHIR